MLLGIDIGTSSCKTALFSENGTVQAQETADYNLYYPASGFVEQDAEEWWRGVCTALKKMFSKSGLSPSEVQAVGIDGQSWSAIPIDKDGEALARTPIWMDTRAESICRELDETVGGEWIFNVCGNPLKPSYSLPKILWFRRNAPELYSNTYKFLQSNGYIGFKLTGKITLDKSQCYGFQTFNLREKLFDSELCEAVGLNVSLLPEVVDCHTIIGNVTKEASLQTGLPEGVPVVAGGLDAACATLGVGVINHGETQEQGGQAGGMSICLETYTDDERLITGLHVVPGRWLLQGGTVGGGSALRWFRESFCRNVSFKELDIEATDVPAGAEGVVFLPYLSGERSPIWDSHAKGVFYGLDFSKSRAHMLRAVLEGVAFSLKHNLEVAESAGARVNELRATGGSASSRLWTQIKSDITGKRLSVPSGETAAALGAAILAGVAVGVYADFGDAVRQTVSITRSHEPDLNSADAYGKSYATYLELYTRLRGL